MGIIGGEHQFHTVLARILGGLGRKGPAARQGRSVIDGGLGQLFQSQGFAGVVPGKVLHCQGGHQLVGAGQGHGDLVVLVIFGTRHRDGGGVGAACYYGVGAGVVQVSILNVQPGQVGFLGLGGAVAGALRQGGQLGGAAGPHHDAAGGVGHGGGGGCLFNGQGHGNAGGVVVGLGVHGCPHGVAARIGGQAVGVRTFAAGLVLVGDCAGIGFIVHQGDGGGGDGRRAAGVEQSLVRVAPGQGGGSRGDGVGGLIVSRAGVVALAGDGDGVGTCVDGIAAVCHGVVTLGQGIAVQLHGDGGSLALAVVGKALRAQGHFGLGDRRLADGDLDLYRLGVAVVLIAHHLVPDGVAAHIGAGWDCSIVRALFLGAVLQGAASGGACRHQGLGLAGVGQGVGGRGLGHCGLDLGDLEGGGAADGIVAAFLVRDGNGGIGANVHIVGIGNGVLGFGDHGFAVLDGDNGGGDGFASELEAGAAQLNGGVADLLGIDGDELSSGQFPVGDGQYRHAGSQRFGADGHPVGHILGLAAFAGGGDHHAGGVQAVAVGIGGLVGGLGHGDTLYRILRHGQRNAAGGGGVVVCIVGGKGPGVVPCTHGQGLACVQRHGARRVGSRMAQGDAGNVRGVVNGFRAAHRHIGHGGCGLGDLESACDGAGVVALAGGGDGGLSRIGVVLIGEGVVGILGQRFAVQGDGDILPAGLFRTAVIDVTAAHLHLCAIQRFGVYGKGKADFRAGVVLAGNSEGFGITAHGKPGFGLDGKGRRPIRGKGGGDIDKARFRRDGVICAGGQRNCYRLVSGIGDGHGLGVGCFRIADCFIAEVQRRRGRRNGISRYELGDHDLQRLADIPHRVFGDDVNILCACCQICESDGVLPACHIRTVTGNNVSRLRCAAFHDCIVIFARFVAGKLHRRGGFAVAGSRAIGKRRGGGVNGEGNCFKRAGVIGQFGIVVFTAVILFAEHIKGIGSICKGSRNCNLHLPVCGGRLCNSAVILRAAVIRQDDGDVLVIPGARPGVIQRNGIAGLAAGGFFRYAKLAAII